MRTDRTLLRRYVKLRWHRCLLVEAMRVVAFRNMDHLYVSRVALGVSDWADRDGSDRVFDKMLLNQGMEQNEANRWVLGWASRASWEVYMCLLYAGIEHYRRVTRDHPETRFRPLEEWLDRHNELVEHLRAIRHKLLHPLSEANYLDGLSGIGAAAKHAAPDVFLAIEQLQNQLDDFLEYFRDCLHKSLGDEIAELPGNEMIAHFRARTEKLASSADASTSTRVQTAMRRSVEQLEAMERSLGMEPGSGLALTEAQMQRVRRLDKAVNELDLPLPKRPYRKSRESVQTPVVPNCLGGCWRRASAARSLDSSRVFRAGCFAIEAGCWNCWFVLLPFSTKRSLPSSLISVRCFLILLSKRSPKTKTCGRRLRGGACLENRVRSWKRPWWKRRLSGSRSGSWWSHCGSTAS